jgi:hypothetical protein
MILVKLVFCLAAFLGALLWWEGTHSSVASASSNDAWDHAMVERSVRAQEAQVRALEAQTRALADIARAASKCK